MSSATIRPMFHVVLECDAGELSPEIGEQAARDIADEFAHRPWHTNVRCTWDNHCMRLEANNGYDDKGLALCDEFSDAIAACAAMYERLGDIRIISVTEF
jgi:hypothetical protein